MDYLELIRKEIIDKFDNYLIKYQDLYHEYSEYNDLLEVHIKTQTEDCYEAFILSICQESQTINIRQFRLPDAVKGKGIIYSLISNTFQVAKKYNYSTLVHNLNLVNGYGTKLLDRGAIKIDWETVEIVDSTNLSK